MRLSNFLMWQSAYSELVFLPIYWPDFDRQAVPVGASTPSTPATRRFGGLDEAGRAPTKVRSAS